MWSHSCSPGADNTPAASWGPCESTQPCPDPQQEGPPHVPPLICCVIIAMEMKHLNWQQINTQASRWPEGSRCFCKTSSMQANWASEAAAQPHGLITMIIIVYRDTLMLRSVCVGGGALWWQILVFLPSAADQAGILNPPDLHPCRCRREQGAFFGHIERVFVCLFVFKWAKQEFPHDNYGV